MNEVEWKTMFALHSARTLTAIAAVNLRKCKKKTHTQRAAQIANDIRKEHKIITQHTFLAVDSTWSCVAEKHGDSKQSHEKKTQAKNKNQW